MSVHLPMFLGAFVWTPIFQSGESQKFLNSFESERVATWAWVTNSGMRFMSLHVSDFFFVTFVFWACFTSGFQGKLVKNTFDHPALGFSGQSMAKHRILVLGSIIHQADGGKHDAECWTLHETVKRFFFQMTSVLIHLSGRHILERISWHLEQWTEWAWTSFSPRWAVVNLCTKNL